ncbi:uncharacterized protein LOC111708524 [Eurytemora carolleeae]|uniref:uncharacterized protein LOC111708524 n=1 Tax=Eurytemora carolleeae TaxID=1294199 RepID=UPI000C77820E|nr:uncharacterized protein LOC111708524 [Eurytemora carolleeae]|eukprot:XP_023337699.1 uncharacterized protein LOC111708524 [Eurytemora affinis]
MVHGEGETRTESRQCWNLAYEDGKYSGAGCYKGELCHHEHCYNDTTVCLCTESECNDWSATGNVTTDVPVTGGSGLLCYSGTFDNYEAKPCAESETLCMGFSGGQGTFDCYDPQTNDALFVTNGCWDGVDIEQTQDSTVGRLCLCSDEPLCNERFKDQPGGAGYILLNPVFVPTLIVVWILSAVQKPV